MTTDFIQGNINSKDNSRLEEFLTHYPYGEERKAFVFELIEENKQLLEKAFTQIIKTNLLKNPQNNGMIDFKIWAFSKVDLAVDMAERKSSSNPAKLFSDILQAIIK